VIELETVLEKELLKVALDDARESEVLLIQLLDTLKTVCENCEWLESDFPIIARVEQHLKVGD
jgi:hypothetical protein